MVLLGILMGVLAATLQSVSYLASRHYTETRTGGRKELLVQAHIIMGASSLLILPFIWPGEKQDWSMLWNPLLATSICYLVGQLFLMVALRFAEPSRVSLMLAFKLVVLAVFTMVLRHTLLSPMQFVAMGLCMTGTMLLNTGDGRIDARAALAVLGGCIFYSSSDWNIKRLIDACGPMPLWQKYLWATLITYAFCGLIAVAFLPKLGSRKMKDWVDASPFAYSWLLAMVALYSCFGALGDVLFGNILQSTRGLISVVIGFVIAHLGHVHLEQKTSRGVFVKRLLVATLMTGAVAIYAIEKKRHGQ